MWQLLLWLLYTILTCSDGDESVQHLVLLDDLHLPPPVQLTIRSDFEGVVEFVESDRFQVVLNVTAPSLDDAYLVQHDFIEHRGGLLLQLYKNHPEPWFKYVTLPKICGTLISLALLALVISVTYSCWWYRREPVKILDSSQDDGGQNQPLIYQPTTVDNTKHYAETVVFADGLQRLRSDYSVDGHSSRDEMSAQNMNDTRKRPGPKRYVKPKLQRKPSSDDEDEDEFTLPKRQVSPRKTQKRKKYRL